MSHQSDWEVVVKFRCDNLLEHSEPNAHDIVMGLLKDEGVLSFCDDSIGEIVSIRPVPDKDEKQ